MIRPVKVNLDEAQRQRDAALQRLEEQINDMIFERMLEGKKSLDVRFDVVESGAEEKHITKQLKAAGYKVKEPTFSNLDRFTVEW